MHVTANSALLKPSMALLNFVFFLFFEKATNKVGNSMSINHNLIMKIWRNIEITSVDVDFFFLFNEFKHNTSIILKYQKTLEMFMFF